MLDFAAGGTAFTAGAAGLRTGGVCFRGATGFPFWAAFLTWGTAFAVAGFDVAADFTLACRGAAGFFGATFCIGFFTVTTFFAVTAFFTGTTFLAGTACFVAATLRTGALAFCAAFVAGLAAGFFAVTFFTGALVVATFLIGAFFAAAPFATGLAVAVFLTLGLTGAAFFATTFFATGFCAATFFTGLATALVTGFLAAGFFAATDLATGFFATGFFATALGAATFFEAGFFTAEVLPAAGLRTDPAATLTGFDAEAPAFFAGATTFLLATDFAAVLPVFTATVLLP